MQWNTYSECRGRPACGEVVIRCSRGDNDHPWVRGRKAMYEKLGKRVIVFVTASGDISFSQPDRPVAATRVASRRPRGPYGGRAQH